MGMNAGRCACSLVNRPERHSIAGPYRACIPSPAIAQALTHFKKRSASFLGILCQPNRHAGLAQLSQSYQQIHSHLLGMDFSQNLTMREAAGLQPPVSCPASAHSGRCSSASLLAPGVGRYTAQQDGANKGNGEHGILASWVLRAWRWQTACGLLWGHCWGVQAQGVSLGVKDLDTCGVRTYQNTASMRQFRFWSHHEEHRRNRISPGNFDWAAS